MKLNAEEYSALCKQASPRSPLARDCCWAFFVGGAICCAGEGLGTLYRALGFTLTDAGTLTSATLVALSGLFTALGWYQKLAAKAGAGTLVPILSLIHISVRPQKMLLPAEFFQRAGAHPAGQGRGQLRLGKKRLLFHASTFLALPLLYNRNTFAQRGSNS